MVAVVVVVAAGVNWTKLQALRGTERGRESEKTDDVNVLETTE